MLPLINVKEGTLIFEEGQSDRTMFIVLNGNIQLYVTRNNREIEISSIRKYEFFGEIEMYKNRPRGMSAKAVTSARLAVIKTRMQLEQFMTENPTFTEKMTRMMGRRLAQTNLAQSTINS